jgi:deoxyribodipyrimidine photolyase-related protein
MATHSRLIVLLWDQLSHAYVQELAAARGTDTILLVEAPFLRQPGGHAKKIALVWSAQRSFTQELRQEGHRVICSDRAPERHFLETVVAVARERGHSTVAYIRPRDRTARQSLSRPLADAGLAVEELSDPFWLTSPDAFLQWRNSRRESKMEDYYRMVRRRDGILMRDDAPEGGKWNYDHENRKPFPKKRPHVEPFRVEPDALTQGVLAEVERWIEPRRLYGDLHGFAYPVTRADAQSALSHFIAHNLSRFGDYEDAMSATDAFGHHSLLSIPLNLSLLSPQECVEAALAAYADGKAPLNSVEGFVRQIIGWREYLYHSYESFPGDYLTVNALNHTRPLPAWYWTGETRMRCLRTVIGRVLEHAYTHHIERLMVLGNFALLMGADPQELNRWFWSLYADAFEWVVTPNVVGMSQFADGGWVSTKPYISSGAYINRMSDYCRECIYNPGESVGENACPFTTLYWAFLMEHESSPLSSRMVQNLFGLRGKPEPERERIHARKRQLLTMADQL